LNYYVGSDRGVASWANGYIKRVAYWSSKLDNSTMQALTTP